MRFGLGRKIDVVNNSYKMIKYADSPSEEAEIELLLVAALFDMK